MVFCARSFSLSHFSLLIIRGHFTLLLLAESTWENCTWFSFLYILLLLSHIADDDLIAWGHSLWKRFSDGWHFGCLDSPLCSSLADLLLPLCEENLHSSTPLWKIKLNKNHEKHPLQFGHFYQLVYHFFCHHHKNMLKKETFLGSKKSIQQNIVFKAPILP